MDVRILGPLEVLVDGAQIDLGSPRQRAVLARLVINPGEAIGIDRLIDDLWPGNVPDSARHALHVYLSNLRGVLGPNRERLVRRGSGYLFSIGPEELDAKRFTRLLNDGRSALERADPDAARSLLSEALALWRGPVLADIADESFVYAESARLEELRLVAYELRITADLELGRHDLLIEELRDLVETHPFRERLWEHLMLALYRSGRQAEALEALQNARSRLVEDLGLEPGPALRHLEEQILQQDPNLDLGRAHGEAATARLPLPRTSFIGRQRELELGGELLRSARLLTLVGPPGSGKTRMAIQLATQNATEFDDGPFFVSLAAVNDVGLVDATIAKTLGLRDVPGEEPIDGLKGYLGPRRALVVLDNFEQLIGAAPMVGELLEAAQKTTIMVTSRTPLGISGEQQFPIAPLAVPPLDKLLTDTDIEAYDATALFAARARTSQPSFTVDEGTATDIATVTAQLDGLPLAIELAAARMRLLTPHDLLVRLRERRSALGAGPTDVDHRHRTLQEAIAWSYDALEPGEQSLFRRLGVFRGFTLESASVVTGLPDESVFVGIDRLLSQSLVYRVDSDASARYAMLETLRDFALDRSDIAGESKEVATNHAGFYRRLAEEAELPLTRESAHETVALLLVELDNIRSALQHCIDTGDADTGLFLAGSIWRFFQNIGRLTEARQWFETLLALPGASTAARAKGLTGLAGMEYWQGDHIAADAHYEEALICYRELGDRFNEADTLFAMSMSAQHDLEQCESRAREALLMFEELGSREKSGQVYMAIAALMHRRGRHGEARPLWERALSIAYELGDRQLAVTQEIGIGICEYHAGDSEQALRIALRCLNEAEGLDNVHLAVWMLEYVAAFSASINPRQAACLAGAVDALQRRAGGFIPLDALGIRDARGVAAEALGPDEYLEAVSRGRALTLDQAIEYARGLHHLPGDQT